MLEGGNDMVRAALASNIESVAGVRRLEAASLAELPQVNLAVKHFIHAGVYVRTVEIPANGMITGVEIKIPTVVIVSGSVYVSGGQFFGGYHVLPAAPGRKQAFFSPGGAHLTMFFATKATTVEEAEAEFTDEPHLLQTRRSACPA